MHVFSQLLPLRRLSLCEETAKTAPVPFRALRVRLRRGPAERGGGGELEIHVWFVLLILSPPPSHPNRLASCSVIFVFSVLVSEGSAGFCCSPVLGRDLCFLRGQPKPWQGPREGRDWPVRVVRHGGFPGDRASQALLRVPPLGLLRGGSSRRGLFRPSDGTARTPARILSAKGRPSTPVPRLQNRRPSLSLRRPPALRNFPEASS